MSAAARTDTAPAPPVRDPEPSRSEWTSPPAPQRLGPVPPAGAASHPRHNSRGRQGARRPAQRHEACTRQPSRAPLRQPGTVKTPVHTNLTDRGGSYLGSTHAPPEAVHCPIQPRPASGVGNCPGAMSAHRQIRALDIGADWRRSDALRSRPIAATADVGRSAHCENVRD